MAQIEKKITTNMKVLIVDDFDTSRRTLRMILKSLNYTSLEDAVDGRDALQKVTEDSRIRLVLLDWNMPVMSGMDFLRELRKVPKAKEIKVIMVTAETLQANIVTAVQAGVDQYIVKPVMPKTLEEKIVHVLNKELQDLKARLTKEETLIIRGSTSEEVSKVKIKEMYKASLDHFVRTIELYPWKPAPHYELARVYLKLGQLLDAKKTLETALEIDPLHEPSCIELSRIFMKRREAHKAVKVLSGLATFHPSTVLFQELGEAHFLNGDTNKSIKAFNDSIQYANNLKKIPKRKLAEKHEGLGNAFRKKYEETNESSWEKKSIESLEKSVEYDANYISAHFNLITAYKRSGQDQKAAEMLKVTASITPDDSEGWLSLGKVFIENKEPPKAAFAFKRAIELSDLKGQTYFEIGDIYEDYELEMATKFLLRANLTMPGQSYILNKLGMVQRKRGNLEESIKFYENAIQADPEDEKICFNLAFALLKSNKANAKDEARKHLKTALKILPDFKEAESLLQSIS